LDITKSLDEDLEKAFAEFSLSPTQSARVKLRGKLRVIADALDVESYQHAGKEQELLALAASRVRELSELVLVAPVNSIVSENSPKAKAKKPVQPDGRRASVIGQYIGIRLFTDILQAIRRLK
jgi:hypothetical protein